MGQQQRPAPLRLADDVDHMDVEILDPGEELRKAVQFGGRGLVVELIQPVGTEIAEERRIAAIAPPASSGTGGIR